MKRSKAIKQAKRRAVERWKERYQLTYEAVMQQKDAQIERLTLEWQTTQNTNLRLHHELDVLRLETQSCRDRVTSWSNRSAKAEKERDAAQERVRQLDADCARLRAGIDDSKAGCLSCPARNEAEMRASGLESDLQSLVDENAQLRMGERARFDAGTAMLKAQCERLERDRDQSAAALDTERWQTQALAGRLVRIGEALSCASSETVVDMLARIQAFADDRDRLESANVEWRKTVDACRQETQSAWDRANDLLRQRDLKGAENEVLSARVAEMEAALRAEDAACTGKDGY